MSKGSGGPKDQYVGSYPRWQNGRLVRVSWHFRGHARRLGFLPSLLQLDFGF